MDDSSLFWSHLGILTRDRYKAILGVYESLEEATKHVGPEFFESLGCRKDTIEKVLLKMEEFDPKKVENSLEEFGIQVIAIDDERYPKRLFETADPPVFLYVRGDSNVLHEPSIALVGTRKMSPYGRRVTETFVEPIVHAGMVTVSGLANGVDTIVAEETLKANGKTIAVLAHGLDMISPKANEELAEKILEAGGALIAEEPMGTPPDMYLFPKRNRIIAGLALGTVVLEAPEGSGALITARHAIDESRDVFIVPGQIFDEHYTGSHKMLSTGQAKLVTNAQEVLQEFGVAVRESAVSDFEPSNDLEGAVFAALSTMPQAIDDIVTLAKKSPAEVASALTMLELQGVAKNTGNGMWAKQ